MEEIVMKNCNTFTTLFELVSPWSKLDTGMGQIAWIKSFGVPFHIWFIVYVTSIGSIKESVRITVDDNVFLIHVVEDVPCSESQTRAWWTKLRDISIDNPSLSISTIVVANSVDEGDTDGNIQISTAPHERQNNTEPTTIEGQIKTNDEELQNFEMVREVQDPVCMIGSMEKEPLVSSDMGEQVGSESTSSTRTQSLSLCNTMLDGQGYNSSVSKSQSGPFSKIEDLYYGLFVNDRPTREVEELNRLADCEPCNLTNASKHPFAASKLGHRLRKRPLEEILQLRLSKWAIGKMKKT
ncbi:hypothetical protein Ancab_032270 [Ancistrocladus abbreviatus]